MRNLLLIIIFLSMLVPRIDAQIPTSLHIEVLNQRAETIVAGEIRIFSEDGSPIISRTIRKRKINILGKLALGTVTVEIESPGFELFRQTITLKSGENFFTAHLKIQEFKAEVTVEQTEIERRLNQAFSGYLSQEEIDSLPDDPREIEKELKRRYGDDAIITINGFTGGPIPPKEAIRSIQVSRSSFDAEFHELGKPSINIVTKAFIPKILGMVMFNYGNSAVNAKNAFASEKLPEQNQNLVGMVMGPITNKASFNFSFSRFSSSREETIIATTPMGEQSAREESNLASRSILGEINYDTGFKHTLRLGVQNSSTKNTNAGVGGLSLLERGFNSDGSVNEIKASLSGTIGKKLSNQFRSRLIFSSNDSLSNSQEVGVTVADAFSGGGSGVDNKSDVTKFEAFEMLSAGWGKHFVKFGGEYHFERRKTFSANGTNGSFFFLNLKAYELGLPSTYYLTDGTSDLSFTRNDFAFFLQDDFRIAKRMQIGLGLRYEKQNNLADANNFSPRLSLAYVIDEKAKFVIRSGAGILYKWHTSDTIQRIRENDGRQSSQLVINNPGFPDPSLDLMPGGVLQDSLPPSVYRQAEDLTNPYLFVTQTALNMNFGNGLKFDASYKFERGVHMFRSRDINAPIDGIRPNADFGRIRLLESSGNYARNSLNVSGTGVLFKRVRVNGRYLLSKATSDYEGIFGLPMDNFDLNSERGTASQDQRHFFTGDFDYSPFKDFRINPSFKIGSPFPYNIITGFDDNRDSVFNDRPLGVARNSARAEWTKTVDLSLSYAIPIIKRNISVTRDGKKQTSSNLPDAIKYHRINLFVNIGNLLNTTNGTGYVGNQLSPFFGLPTVAAPARSISFGLMFLYF